MFRDIEKDIQQYYADRANEYDLTYERPERQNDLKIPKGFLRVILSGVKKF